METRHQFIVSSDRLKDPGIKPAVPGLKGRTHAVNTNCFRLVKQQCGLITDPARYFFFFFFFFFFSEGPWDKNSTAKHSTILGSRMSFRLFTYKKPVN